MSIVNKFSESIDFAFIILNKISPRLGVFLKIGGDVGEKNPSTMRVLACMRTFLGLEKSAPEVTRVVGGFFVYCQLLKKRTFFRDLLRKFLSKGRAFLKKGEGLG